MNDTSKLRYIFFSYTGDIDEPKTLVGTKPVREKLKIIRLWHGGVKLRIYGAEISVSLTKKDKNLIRVNSAPSLLEDN